MADDPINQQQFEEDVLAAADTNGGDINLNNLPNIDEVLKLVEQMEGISEEEFANIKKNLYNQKEFAKHYDKSTVDGTSWDYMIFLAMIVTISLIFALFGYKLYKSLMERELKKQEKLKQKQSKKSKKIN